MLGEGINNSLSQKADGSFEMAMPYPSSSPIPLASAEDTRALVATIIAGGDKFYNKRLSLVTEFLSDEHKLKVWTEGELCFPDM